MEKKYYDLHIHSCLSPCADNDMTPSNIAGMASLKGLDIIALTDHNTIKELSRLFSRMRKTRRCSGGGHGAYNGRGHSFDLSFPGA